MEELVVRTSGLAVGYEGRAVLSDIGLTLGRGSMVALIGANGSGKSTLLRTLVGLQPALAGSVAICGRDVRSFSRREMAERVATVFTDRSGGGGLTVREVVETGRHPYTGVFGRLSASDRDMVDKALADVGMTDKAYRFVGSLSDGERQKVMIAAALAQDTAIIILDEPTAFLDVAGRIDVMSLLRTLADGGKSIVLSTHDISSAVRLADLLWVVDRQADTVLSGACDSMVSDGTLARAFPSLRFDPTLRDFVS